VVGEFCEHRPSFMCFLIVMQNRYLKPSARPERASAKLMEYCEKNNVSITYMCPTHSSTSQGDLPERIRGFGNQDIDGIVTRQGGGQFELRLQFGREILQGMDRDADFSAQ
jgi:hypothetical protein